jgi:hypothetical protein
MEEILLVFLICLYLHLLNKIKKEELNDVFDNLYDNAAMFNYMV